MSPNKKGKWPCDEEGVLPRPEKRKSTGIRKDCNTPTEKAEQLPTGIRKKCSTPAEAAKPEQRVGPSPEELKKLQKILMYMQVTLLTVEEGEALLGSNPQRLRKGTYGEAFLSAAENVVIKLSFDYNSFLSVSVERLGRAAARRRVPRTLHDGHQIRRPDPVPRLGKNSPVLPLQWLDVAIQVTEILQEMHSLRIIHNDIKTNNLCLDITPEGVEVTVIDFALATEKGEYVIFFRRLEVLLLLPSRSLREGGRLKWSLRCLWLGARHVEDPAVRPPGDDGADRVAAEPEL